MVLRSVSALACRSASSGDVYTTRQGRKLSVRQRQAEVLGRPGDMWRQVGCNARNQAVEVCRRLDVIGLFMGTRSSRLQRMAVCNFWERGHIRLCWEIVYNFWDRGDDCLCRTTVYFLDRVQICLQRMMELYIRFVWEMTSEKIFPVIISKRSK